MSAYTPQPILQVGIDVGSTNHTVAISDGMGHIVKEFEIAHNAKGFEQFFRIVEKVSSGTPAEVHVAMEGYNGWARPFDGLIREKGYRLYNVNNVKLARFKEIFPGAAKNDIIDARKIVELFSLQTFLPTSKKVLQEILITDDVNERLKKLTRRRKQLIGEKVMILNRLSAELQATAPELLAITQKVDNLWFLRFITLKKDIRQVARVRKNSILDISRIGPKRLAVIQGWQKEASFSPSLVYTAPMIYDDAVRLLELIDKIKALKEEISVLNADSSIARVIETIPGFSTISAGELAGEIGTITRFENEASLALYLGMTNLDNSSGKRKGSKRSISTNRHTKAAMTTAVMKHAQHTEESKKYLEKKKAEGKHYLQAIRSLGRHLVRVIWSMIQENRPYRIA